MRTAVLMALCAGTLAGCAGSTEADVERAADGFGQALRAEDGEAACRALAPLTVEELESSEEQPCAEALPEVGLLTPTELGPVERFGRQASVVVRGDDGRSDTWYLSRFGDRWLVVAAGCQPRGEDLPAQCDVEGA